MYNSLLEGTFFTFVGNTKNMDKQAVAALFYQEWRKIQAAETQDVAALYRLLNLVFLEATRQERLQFTTLFARMAYVCQREQVSKQLQYYLHQFRRSAQRLAFEDKEGAETTYELGLKVVAEIIEAVFQEKMPQDVVATSPKDWALPFQAVQIRAFRQKVRGVLLSEDMEREQFVFQEEKEVGEAVRVQYNIPDRNENFNPTVQVIRQVFDFPVTVNLLDVEVDKAGVLRPKAIVVEPDYLVDVSAISECFKEFGAEPLFYLLKKYLPVIPNKYLMIGNIANFFLDELMTDSDATFRELFPKVFRLNPLAFCLFDDREVREIMQKSQRHFTTLKQMVKQGFAGQGIEPQRCFLEPSFYSETHGIQGRLDVFYQSEDNEHSAIVELKSGKPFMPNQYGISASHFTQTLLYDLMVGAVFNGQLDPKNYILYSGQQQDQLRFAPRVRAQQYEALQVRNQIVASEWQLQDLSRWFSKRGLSRELIDRPNILRKLSPNRFPRVKGFLAQDLADFEKVYGNLTKVERKYFNAFSGFIAREHQLTKTGVQGIEGVNGLANLWLNSFAEKEEQFDILGSLQVQSNQAEAEEPLLVFEKTADTQALANFRKGDIAVLYPADYNKVQPVLSNQIFKCTILEVTKTTVQVRLRYRQFNNRIFSEERLWNLEHDVLDSSFTAMYRSLFAFMRYREEKRQLLLTQKAPKPPNDRAIEAPQALTHEQQAIFQQLLQSQDYFLLWGPPGTGKTSMMLKHLVGHLLQKTEENVLLLAFTNRAVDEICEAIEGLGAWIRDDYIRIGSRYSTEECFQLQLLQGKIEAVGSRKALLDVLQKHRIFVSTVSSISMKMELLKLKRFDRVIIDEASQILEPLLVGLLPYFKHFTLIGDHRQLPAVVVQDPDESQLKDKELNALGLNNSRNSLFERLYTRCQQENWHWAYARLTHQGRMHEDIMAFPNAHFYHEQLRILPERIAHSLSQKQPLTYKVNGEESELIQWLCERRVLFIPTPIDDAGATHKTNVHEAQLIAELVAGFQRLFSANGYGLSAKSIGIITPYRAQIAQIQQVLVEKELDTDSLTIDTVERYQGGARDVILISLCTNTPNQIRSLVSLSDEGIDRKLNVALTRARQHLVIVGNPELLRGSPIYEALVEEYGVGWEVQV